MKGHDDHKSSSNFHVTGYTFKRNISLLTGKTNKLENKSCGKWKNHCSSRAWKNHYYNNMETSLFFQGMEKSFSHPGLENLAQPYRGKVQFSLKSWLENLILNQLLWSGGELSKTVFHHWTVRGVVVWVELTEKLGNSKVEEGRRVAGTLLLSSAMRWRWKPN